MKKFQMKKLAFVMALGLSAVTGTQAMAQVNSFEEAKYQIASGKRVVEVGFSKENTRPLKGFATSLPLVEVLKQITPNGWVVKKNDSAENRIDINKLVSWTGGNPWNVTLDGVIRQAGTNAIIDWDKKEVVLIALPQVSKKMIVETSNTSKSSANNEAKSSRDDSISVFELEGNSGNNQTVVSGETNYKNMPAVVVTKQVIKEEIKTEISKTTTSDFEEKQALANQEWILSSEKTLKQNVKDWGVQAGYKVEWLGEDYPIDRSMTIHGEFEGEEGPIRQLSVDYGPDSRLQKPLSFILYQNRVLVVEDMKYEQQGFPQMGQ